MVLLFIIIFVTYFSVINSIKDSTKNSFSTINSVENPTKTISISKEGCGDNICALSEDCNNCNKDCGCKSGESCNSVGICRKNDLCGDNICSDKEKNSCCKDCGCENGVVCNKITQTCQPKIEVSETDINKVVTDFLQKNNIQGEIIKITDEYYGEKTVKKVRINCNLENTEYPCEIILFIDDSGNIIDKMQTS